MVIQIQPPQPLQISRKNHQKILAIVGMVIRSKLIHILMVQGKNYLKAKCLESTLIGKLKTKLAVSDETFIHNLKYITRPFKILYLIVVILMPLFIINVSIIFIVRSAIGNLDKRRYCDVIQHNNVKPYVLMINVDKNYKLQWTYDGMMVTTLDNKNSYYPNKFSMNSSSRSN